MCRVPPQLMPILLLIIMDMIIAVLADIVVEYATTTEEVDMAKAMALRKRNFWREMVQKWQCKKFDEKPADIGIKSTEEQRKICETWKAMAIAADTYVANWEYVQNQAAAGKGEPCSSSSTAARIKDQEYRFEGRCMKPSFLMEQGELQMSSAMEVIKGVYRDLFNWGEGNALKISDKVKFENQQAWNENAPPNTLSEKFNASRAARNYMLQLLALWEKLNSEMATELHTELWDLTEEIGFDMGSMCEAGRKFKIENDKSELHKARSDYKTKIVKMFTNNYVLKVYENWLGILLWHIKQRIERLEWKPRVDFKDPCEEAKLNVYKTKVGALQTERQVKSI